MAIPWMETLVIIHEASLLESFGKSAVVMYIKWKKSTNAMTELTSKINSLSCHEYMKTIAT